ncbi:MAG: PaaI family thioesterase [Candidatus Limnocylindrales bacterium]
MNRALGASVQERYAPGSICFGCGPANPKGLHVRSFPDPDPEREDALVATWSPSPEHHAFANVLNGGICGTILDCHANWSAALAIMRLSGADRPPATVTADYEVRLLAPTPTDRPLTLRAWPIEVAGRRATSEARIETDEGIVTATFTGHFVAVHDDHPAHDRWRDGMEPTPGAG